jgi:uncharacterized membrane protein
LNDWLSAVRWIHLLAGAAWLGEVITINFVLVPIVLRSQNSDRRRFIKNVFPLVFRLASILALIAIAAGALLNYQITGWKNLDEYFATPRGLAILVGGLLGLGLTLFHFTLERRLEPLIERLDDESDAEQVEEITSRLRWIPRFGLVVLFLIFILMMYGARGF